MDDEIKRIGTPSATPNDIAREFLKMAPEMVACSVVMYTKAGEVRMMFSGPLTFVKAAVFDLQRGTETLIKAHGNDLSVF